ncbi:hypothetical protein ACJMK2_032281 [Sinanodonta woodiana]|uniref:Short-chain collagen C4-like n=1 Tax=Sinanodonta woodiana TaxID=1069815 RepID=A0ABD3X188_SINWO
MLAARFILFVVLTVSVGTAILEGVGRTDLEADRNGLERSRRNLLDNNFDLLTLRTGNGPNNLCLPEDPTWAKYLDGTFGGDHRARVYGTEYETGGGENDVPCAVCRTTRFSSIMIPGRINCYSGWTVEYSGYLVSAHYGHASPIEYVCLDGNPESIDGGHANLNGHLIYLVDVICGSLRCPPYVNGRELACVVCSK